MIYLNKIENKTDDSPNNTENQETLIICNFIYFGSWHLREKGFMGGFRGGSEGVFKEIPKASIKKLMTLVLYYVLFHLKFYGFPFFQHKHNTSTFILNSHHCDRLFHKCKGVIGEELEIGKES